MRQGWIEYITVSFNPAMLDAYAIHKGNAFNISGLFVTWHIPDYTHGIDVTLLHFCPNSLLQPY